jgi:hypothetical protein
MMMKKITALSLVACAMLVVSVRESQAEEWPDVLDNGCSYAPSPEWTKFGDWCHSESGKSDHHDPDRDDCKDFGGTSHPHWCIATPAVSMNDEAQVIEDMEEMESDLLLLKEEIAEKDTSIAELESQIEELTGQRDKAVAERTGCQAPFKCMQEWPLANAGAGPGDGARKYGASNGSTCRWEP